MANDTTKPRIMIGVPGFAGVQPECQENFFAFAFRCGRDMPDYDFLLRIITKKEQFRARNNLVNMAIANACDYLLMLDDDMLIPPTLLTQMLAHEKDVLGVLYWQRGGAHHPVLMHLDEHEDGSVGMRFVSPFDPIVSQRGLHRVDVVGGGCILFNMAVFRTITPPYFWWEHTEGTDIGICRRLGEAGVEVWADTSIELGHLGDKQIVTSRTIPQYHAEIGVMKETLVADLQEYFNMSQQELEQAITRAGEQATRQHRWEAKPRDSWEAVCEYYQASDDWSVFNLAYWALMRHDQQRQFAVTEMGRFVPEHGTILDYGPGIGFTTIELAKQGYQVIAAEVAGAGTLAFIRFRALKHGLEDSITYLELDTPFPDKPLGRRIDAALMISVLDHLWSPYETLEWINEHLVPQAPLLCDWESLPHAAEPQHIIQYDPYSFQRWMAQRGLRCSPERTWLFLKD